MDSLVSEFAQKRQIDIAPQMAELRSKERELLRLASTIRRGPLEAFHQTVTDVLDSLQALEESAAVLAGRQDRSHLSSIRQIRATIHRAALRLYAAHPQGLPYARTLLDRIYRDADARNDVVNVDSDVLGVLIHRFRSAEATGVVWRLPADKDHRAAFHAFLSSILSHITDLRVSLFTQIMDIHIDAGTPVSVLEPLISKCMRLHRFPGRWTPAAYNVLILAHRRDGNFRGCLDTYETFRRSLRPSDEAWNRYIASTLPWPYESLLTASLDSQRLAVDAKRFRAPRDMPAKIWDDLQADSVEPPPRLIAYLIRCARINGDVRSAHRLWNVFCPDSPAALEKSSTSPSTPTASSVKLDIDCYLQYLKLLAIPSPSHPPLRPILRRLLEQRITASQSPAFVCSLWTQVLRTALSSGHADFPLAIWTLDRFLCDGLPLDADVIDAVAEGILSYAVAKPRSTRLLRAVLGEEHAANIAGQRRRLPRGVQARNMRSRGVTTRDWDSFSRHLVSLREGKGEMAYLPLGRPLARWTTPRAVPLRVVATSDPRGFGADAETMMQLARCLRGILEACIVTQQRYTFPLEAQGRDRREPGKSVHKEGSTPDTNGSTGEAKAAGVKAGESKVDGRIDRKVVLRRAMQDLYRDLFG